MMFRSNSFLVPQGTDPDEIRRKIKRWRFFSNAIVLVIVIILGIIMQLIVTPKLTRIYEDFNLSVPVILSLAPYIIAGVVILWGFVLLLLIQEEPSYLTSKTEEGYLIITPKGSGRQALVEVVGFLSVGLLVGFFLYIYLSPIWLISSQF